MGNALSSLQSTASAPAASSVPQNVQLSWMSLTPNQKQDLVTTLHDLYSSDLKGPKGDPGITEFGKLTDAEEKGLVSQLFTQYGNQMVGPQGPVGKSQWGSFSSTEKQDLINTLYSMYGSQLTGPPGKDGITSDAVSQLIKTNSVYCDGTNCTAANGSFVGPAGNNLTLKNGAGTANIGLNGNAIVMQGDTALTGNLNVTGYIRSSGKLGDLAATSITLPDTRNDNKPPSFYRPFGSQIIYEFKDGNAISVGGGWYILQTIVPWGDGSGGQVVQRASDAATGTRRMMRYGVSNDSAWGGWLFDNGTAIGDGNFTSYGWEVNETDSQPWIKLHRYHSGGWQGVANMKVNTLTTDNSQKLQITDGNNKSLGCLTYNNGLLGVDPSCASNQQVRFI